RTRISRVSSLDDGPAGQRSHLQPLSHWLGPRDGLTLPMDQAGGVAFWRDPERAGHQLAKTHPCWRRDPFAVPPRHRHRANHTGSCRHGIQAPLLLNGTPQKPLEGVSMVYTFDDGKAPTRHTTQYFEMTANRALYHDDWIASTTPARLPWATIGAARDPEN